ncbi:MAG TPA: hypothetical protein VJ890_21570 [Vineibacter sp.]|nr:hypothetical protein [Vineibacter sp.]
MPPGSNMSELTELKASLDQLATSPATAAAVTAARAYVGKLQSGGTSALPHDMVAFGTGYVTSDGTRAASWEHFQSEKVPYKIYVEGPPPADKPRWHHATPIPRNHAAVTTRYSYMVVLAAAGVAVLRPHTQMRNMGAQPAPRVIQRSAEERAELRRRLQALDRR